MQPRRCIADRRDDQPNPVERASSLRGIPIAGSCSAKQQILYLPKLQIFQIRFARIALH